MAKKPKVKTDVYRPLGGALQLFLCRDPEILYDGPAGTGKSRCTAEYLHWLATEYPGCRMLVVRKTRASLTESWMVTYEQKVLSPNHYILSGPKRTGRHSYDYSNGSTIVLGGMDEATRLFSTEYDVCIVVEATELTEGEFQKIHRALRNGVLPWQQLIAECNPDSEYHWLWRRYTKGLMTRIRSRHRDNPTLTKEYLERLEFQLFGTDLQRLYHGRWCSAEGMVWKNFDRQTHVIAGDLVQEGKQWVLYTGDIRGRDDPLRFEWFFASVDWGFTNPGVLQVWGVDGDNNACRVAEVYRKEKDINWWADKAEDLRKKFDIQHFTCDPSRPENIRVFNKRMVSGGGYGIADKEIASKAKNAKEAGLSVVRERFGRRTVFFWQDALESHDPLLGDDETVINCTEKEIPSYVVRVPKPNQPQPEETDPMCEDHGCDSLRYACMFLDDHDWRPGRVESKEYAIGTYGRVLDHASVFAPQEDNPWWW